jgi:non-specific serine/threonine protein kinase
MLRQQRRAHRLTQAELAERAGLSERAISDLERGLKIPQRVTLHLLLDALQASPEIARAFTISASRTPRSDPAASDHPRHNLPAPVSGFVGREAEIASLRQLLASTAGTPRLVTLTGAAGVGKTRLALMLARTVLDGYADGAFVIELAELLEPSRVLQTVADVVDVRERSPQHMLDALVAALRRRSMLIVLDNCEHLMGACAELTSALLQACPRLRLLTTSREPLRLAGETTWRVRSLTLPGRDEGQSLVDELLRSETGRLFFERAQDARQDFVLTESTARAVAKICWRLEGIPLAVELAAARLRHIDAEQIATRLDDCLGLLVGGTRTSVPRHRTYRAAVEWSYAMLPSDERNIFERLSVFAEDWTLEAAEAVCVGEGIEVDAVLSLLSRLIDRSLVVVGTSTDGQVRYRMLEPIRQYAWERLKSRE